MKKFLFKHKEVIIILVLCLVTAYPLFRSGYFSHHDDLHVIRIFEMRRCFGDFQIPCRWAPDMGAGFGLPIFNFYSVFPYYLGAALSYILGYIGSAKVIFLIPIIAGGVGMYLLAKELFDKNAALLASTLYIFVPYRALDTYVRGAVAESFALGIIPFIFLFSFKLSQKASIKAFLGLIFSLFILLTSHNIMSLLFIPLILIWTLYWQFVNKFQTIKPILVAFAFGLGLSSFFLIPAYFEKGLVQAESLTTGSLDFRVHFAGIKQLFLDRTWGYGASVPGPADQLSLQIGWPHWMIAMLTLIIAILRFRKISAKVFGIMIFLYAIFTFSIFMTHNRSTFIWEGIGILKYLQFPWRFLGLTAFATSLIGGFAIFLLGSSRQLLAILIAVIFLLNFQFFRPQTFYESLTDSQKLSGELWREQQKGAILDYLPKSAKEPKDFAPESPEVKKGSANVLSFQKSSNKWRLETEVKENSTIEIPVFDFANWELMVGEYALPHKVADSGQIAIELTPGRHEVTAKFKNTPIRTVANLISLMSLLTLGFVIRYGKVGKILK